MFASRYFAPRYFAKRYFPQGNPSQNTAVGDFTGPAPRQQLYGILKSFETAPPVVTTYRFTSIRPLWGPPAVMEGSLFTADRHRLSGAMEGPGPESSGELDMVQPVATIYSPMLAPGARGSGDLLYTDPEGLMSSPHGWVAPGPRQYGFILFDTWIGTANGAFTGPAPESPGSLQLKNSFLLSGNMAGPAPEMESEARNSNYPNYIYSPRFSYTFGPAPTMSGTLEQTRTYTLGGAMEGPNFTGFSRIRTRGFRFSEFARQRIAVDQLQGGSTYPFQSADALIHELILDFYVYYDARSDFKPPFRITYLYGAGLAEPTEAPEGFPTGRHKYDVIIVDAENNTVIDTTDAAVRFSNRLWGARIDVSQWNSDKVIVRAAISVSFRQESEVINYPLYITPTDATLHIRTLEQAGPRVLSLNDGTTAFSGQVELVAGNNILIDVTPVTAADGGRNRTRITVHGDPGAGMGRVDACEQELFVTSINEATAQNGGNVFFTGDGCFGIGPPMLGYDENGDVLVEPNTLEIRDDCEPCADCRKFVGLYYQLRSQWQRLNRLARAVDRVRNTHAGNVARFYEASSCRISNPLRIQISQACPCSTTFVIGFCNLTKECGGPLVLNLAFSGIPNATVPIDGFRVNAAAGGDFAVASATGSYPNLSYSWENVDPGSTAAVQVTVRGASCSGAISQVTVSGTFNGVAFTTRSKSSAMVAPNPLTGRCSE